MSKFVEGESLDYESLMKKLSPDALIGLAMFQVDSAQVITEVNIDKDGKFLCVGHAKCPPVNWDGIWFPEEFAKLVDSIIHKPTKTEWEQEFTTKIFDIFFSYMDDCDSFANWDNYHRFVTTISEDFFGID